MACACDACFYGLSAQKLPVAQYGQELQGLVVMEDCIDTSACTNSSRPHAQVAMELPVTRDKHMKHLDGALQGRLLHRGHFHCSIL